jgi:polyphosphate kinase 2 (PPK2 family)
MERTRWLVEPGRRIDLTKEQTHSTEGAPGDKLETDRASESPRRELALLQHRLYAEGRRSLLLVLQAMDAGGKDGTVRRVFSG